MKRRGLTLVELMVGVSLFGMMAMSVLELYAGSLRFFMKTSTDVDLTNETATSVRYVTSKLRSAVSISIQNDGKKIIYSLPKYNNVVDAITGEKEISDPVISDGVARSFTVTNGVLRDDVTGKVLVKNLANKDPDPKSTQYNQVYSPFQLTTIGSRKAVTVTFITLKDSASEKRHTRMKDTVILRNGK